MSVYSLPLLLYLGDAMKWFDGIAVGFLRVLVVFSTSFALSMNYLFAPSGDPVPPGPSVSIPDDMVVVSVVPASVPSGVGPGTGFIVRVSSDK